MRKKIASRFLPTLMGAVTACTTALASGADERYEPVERHRSTLWFQMDDEYSDVSFVSQDFDAAFDIYDSQGADDFVVPKGETWRIYRIYARGSLMGGLDPVFQMRVTFYENGEGKASRPGNVVAEHVKSAKSEGARGSGEYSVAFGEPITLKPGTYWLSLQAIMDPRDDRAGQWQWQTLHRLRGKSAVWKNPQDGYRTGCTEYKPHHVCFGRIGQGPDFMFWLIGKRRIHQ